MALSRAEVIDRINAQGLDELDLVITRDGDGFAVTESRGSGSYVSDIGSCFEVPEKLDEHGRCAFTAGPWTGYQYHASYTAPRRSNYEAELDDLAAGDIRALIVGCGPIPEDDTWVFATRTEA